MARNSAESTSDFVVGKPTTDKRQRTRSTLIHVYCYKKQVTSELKIGLHTQVFFDYVVVTAVIV